MKEFAKMVRKGNLTDTKKIIPIFYACDNAFVKFTAVSIKSLILNSSKEFIYRIYILNTGIDEQLKSNVEELQTENVKIKFVDVREKIEKIDAALPLRDYYSKTTYFRLFIAEMYPEHDKALYIDSDTVVVGNVADLYSVDVEDNYVGACNEQVMVQTEVFGNYVEKVLGINRNNYFNAGILLINCKMWRQENVVKQFVDLLKIYNFVVTQDQDYLNVICHNKVKWLSQEWNVEVYGEIPVLKKDMKIIHYIMVEKPWHYVNCRLKEYFWRFTEKTVFYESINNDLSSYTDEQRQKDCDGAKKLELLAIKESNRLDRYFNIVSGYDVERLKVLDKIRRYEIEEKFDLDVENDPETVILKPDKVDYLSKKFSSKIMTKLANRAAVNFYEKQIKQGNFVIKEIKGIENFACVKSGAILTCNHFNAFDNYAIWRAIRDYVPKGKRLYKIIREGNFTSFKGLYGFFFRHCNTLPLSRNTETMKNLLKALKVLFERNEKVLIYPEQAMWWNYKKPRPLKSGAFKFAAKFNVPVIPCFITMEDTDKVGKDGFKIQAYTVWFLPAIYPQNELSVNENTEYLKAKNFEIWKDLYEKVYKIPLEYAGENECII